MWIRTYKGAYINSDHIIKFNVSNCKFGGFNLSAQMATDVEFVARFETDVDAQDYLDRMMKSTCVRIFEVDMVE